MTDQHKAMNSPKHDLLIEHLTMKLLCRFLGSDAGSTLGQSDINFVEGLLGPLVGALELYLATYADTQTHPTPSQEARCIIAMRAALELRQVEQP